MPTFRKIDNDEAGGVDLRRVVARILKHTIRIGDCLPWQGYTKNGIPIIDVNRLGKNATNVLWEYHHGQKPDRVITRTCNTENCCNVQHMRAGLRPANNVGLPPMERISKNLELTASGCLVWRGARVTSKGGFHYGQVWVGGKLCRTHRIAYEHAHGEIPDGKDVKWLCGNTLCCNVQHLYLSGKWGTDEP
jgi:hypothetical protein